MLRRICVAIALIGCPAFALASILEGPADIERYGLDPVGFSPPSSPSSFDPAWYVVELGDEFSARTVGRGDFPTLDEHLVELQSVYGGWWRQAFFTGPPLVLGYVLQDGSEDVYGWHSSDFFESQSTTGTAFVLPSYVVFGSAAALGGEGGIIVGTLQAIPEPTSAATVLISAVLASMASRSK